MSEKISLLQKWRRLQLIIRDARITPLAKIIAAIMLDAVDRRTGAADRLTIDDIAGSLGRKRTSVAAAISCLAECGWITERRRRGPTIYTFRFGDDDARESDHHMSDDARESDHHGGDDDARKTDPLDVQKSDHHTPDDARKIDPLDVQKSNHLDPGFTREDKKPGKRPGFLESDSAPADLFDLVGARCGDSPGRTAPNATPPKARKLKCAAPLPDGWLPDFEAASAKFGIQAEREFEKFSDHHLAKGSQFVDWNAAFRQWCRRAKEFRQRDSANGVIIDQQGKPIDPHNTAPRRGRTFLDIAMELNDADE